MVYFCLRLPGAQEKVTELLQTGPPTEQQLHNVLDLLRFAFDIHDVFDSEQFTQLTNIFFHTLQQVSYVLSINVASSTRI